MNFEMVGKLSLSKESERFKPYSETTYDSGWVKRRLMFNAVCGDNRHMLTVDAGSFADGHGFVYTYTKGGVDENGNKVKGESIQIPFKERLTSPKIAEVAEFRKFVVDLEEPGRRYKLQKALEDARLGCAMEVSECEALGLTSGSEEVIKAEYEKSLKRRHEFISEWDFCEFIKKLIDSGKYTDKKFYIKGSGDYSYYDKKQTVYTNYVPQRIYLAADGAEEYSTATLKVLYGQDSLDSMSVEETGKHYVNGWMWERDNQRKGNIPVPVTVVIPAASECATDKEKKLVDRILHKFMVDDDSIKELGVEVNMLNGAQRTEITPDMLTEDQQLDLECGLITMEDIRAELGGSVYGERIQEFQFVKVARGFTKGREETSYTMDDMVIKPLEESLPEGTDDLFQEDEEDLFS